MSFLPAPLNAKRLELLAAVLPQGSAVLNLADPNSVVGMQSVEAAGASLGLLLHAAYASTPAQIDAAIASARKQRVAGRQRAQLAVPFGPARAHRRTRGDGPAARHLPMARDRRDGGLMGYGPSLIGDVSAACRLRARVLGGAKPADLPIEQPTRFELVINLKTAKALDLMIPQPLLLRADEVIE